MGREAGEDAVLDEERPRRPERDARGGREPKPDRPPAPQDDEPRDSSDEATKAPGQPPRRRILPFVIAGLVLALLVAGGVLYWLDARHYESTDDAFVDGHVSQVSAQVSAKVIRLLVIDNQEVAAGQELVTLDPRDFQVRLDQARAQLANAQAQLAQAQAKVAVQQASIDQAQAQVLVAQSDLGRARADLARYRSVSAAAITRQTLDTSNFETRSSEARLESAKQGVVSAQADLQSAKAQVQAAAASVQTSQADVANAELQLSYTHVRAPQAGRVTKRTVELGNYVTPGVALLSVVSDNLWVTANFKETQLADMKPGQPVRVSVDAYPAHDLPGRVDSFQSGTGSYFSSLPAENATGNYVKVVQRVPVKILFEGDAAQRARLAPGLSVTPRVTVR